MRIVTVNVNGVRAAITKGFEEWLAGAEADVITLQEVRAPDEIVTAAFKEGWHVVHEACEVKGRAGVAILSRTPMRDVVSGLHVAGERLWEPVHTGRWIEATVDSPAGDVRIVSAYIHSGEVGTPKMDAKYLFLDRMNERLKEMADAYPLAVITGDFNIAHTNNDLKNWKGNLKTAGFLPEERAYLTRWFEAGWVDTHRVLAGDREGPYTWWSQRGKAFDTDTGWRLDYQVATADLAARATDWKVDRAATWDTRWSDHAPLIIDYAL
jgi:exodeoxyribonuclease III